MIKALSYVLIDTPNYDSWCTFGSQMVGLQVEQMTVGQSARFRLDEKVQRFILRLCATPRLTLGFETSTSDGLAATAARLEQGGFKVEWGTGAECEERGVARYFTFRDPDASNVEVCYGLADSIEAFAPARPIGGFRTGELGLGHIALKTGDFQGMCNLYENLLGFRLSDYGSVPFSARFYHVNPRHHTVGLADTGTGAGIYHLMIEYKEWDDLGRAHDLALAGKCDIGVSLGRHANDHVTSFYAVTPDDWMLELGWAGRLIDADWQVAELEGFSLWGHDRSWLPQAKRQEAKAVLESLAAKGIRAPVVVPKTGA